MPHRLKRLAGVTAILALSACADRAPTEPSAGSDLLTDNAGTAVASIVLPTVVMSNLDNPRGLAFGPEGGLYVVESGTTVTTGPCANVARGPNCYSGTGAVSRWWKGRQERVASGLPSAFNANAFDVIGPTDIAFHGRGNAYITVGWGGNPAARSELGSLGAAFGHLLRMQPNGEWDIDTDISGFEGANNPDGGFVDSNPYGVYAEAGRLFVTDAGGNDLLMVRANGDVSLVAVFPTTPVPPPFNSAEPVPTDVTRGPDGALYVSSLTGAPFVPGIALVYRIGAGGTPQLHEGGFKMAVDHAWGPDGSLYVLEFDTSPGFFFPIPPTGRLTRIAPDGARTVLSETLTAPTAVVVGPDGAVYVSNFGNAVGVGQVLRFEL